MYAVWGEMQRSQRASLQDELSVALSYFAGPPATSTPARPLPPQGDALAQFVLEHLAATCDGTAAASVQQAEALDDVPQTDVIDDAVLGDAAPDWLLKPIMGGAWDLPPECLLKTMEGGARRVRYTSFKRSPIRCVSTNFR